MSERLRIPNTVTDPRLRSLLDRLQGRLNEAEARLLALERAPSSKPLQIVETVDTTNRSTASTTMVASPIAVSITPRDADSKILVRVSGVFGASASLGGLFTLYRDAVDLTPAGVNSIFAANVSADGYLSTIGFEFPDSPATDEEVTYTLYWAVSGVGDIYMGRRGFDTTYDVPTIMTAEEHAG